MRIVYLDDSSYCKYLSNGNKVLYSPISLWMNPKAEFIAESERNKKRIRTLFKTSIGYFLEIRNENKKLFKTYIKYNKGVI